MNAVVDQTRAHDIAWHAVNHHHASQRLDELAAAVARVMAVQPQIIVEIGCDAGGTLYAWRQITAEVYGITLLDNSIPTGGIGAPCDPHGATLIRGDSHDPATRAQLVAALHGRPVDVLVVDGDHSYAGAKADLDDYGPLVRDGGLVLFHDVVNDRDPRVDLTRLWAELTADGRGETITSRTGRPLGWGVLHIERGAETGD